MKIHPVILCGGSGTRLWPLSRSAFPKQFLPLASERTMLQETVTRLDGLEGVAAPIVICNEDHRFLVAEQMRGIDVKPHLLLLEPMGRNTAPAVAAAALALAQDDPDALMLVLPSDHVIRDQASFHRAIRLAAQAADTGLLTTFGIIPNAPETGYGYINRGATLPRLESAFAIDRFVEKPDRPTAERLLASGDYYWNSGMFVLKAGVYLEELGRHSPAVLEAVRKAVAGLSRDLDFCRLDRDAFGASPSISIDYAVMEKTQRGAVIPAQIGWSDVGSWDALWEIQEKSPEGNVIQGDVLAAKARNSYIRAESRMVAAIGVEDLVIVETADAVLVMRRDAAQDVKGVVDRIKADGRSEHELHRRVYRPWGSYEGIAEGGRHLVKRLTVNPGQKLSLQLHHHRAEHWVVVQGTAKVVRGEEEILLSENESTYIPLGVKHRLENPGRVPLQLIEVQSGGYLREDDIVRFDDVYNRVEPTAGRK